jgi:hypothetical protein
MEGAITAHVVVDESGMTGHGHLTLLGLSWQRAEPLAVALTLAAQPDHPALPRGEWVVLRDFLRYGLEEPTGDGAVRIRPDQDGRVLLELIGESKTYAVHAPVAMISDFLDETERLVPHGAEAGDAVMDALIARLLDTAQD